MQANQRLSEVSDLLLPLGITLLPEQPHISGERVLRSESRLVLIGTHRAGEKVVIKAAWEPDVIKEVVHEREAREALEALPFADNQMLLPEVVFAGQRGAYYLYITRHITQDKIFVERPVSEQFFIALNAFEAQEAFHATTFEHNRRIRKVFEVYTAETYLEKFRGYMKVCESYPSLSDTLARSYDFLASNKTTIARYLNYLIHNDFVPHNMRIQGRNLYVLDLASFWFGNKYEGWARLANYMLHHGPQLERMIVSYIKENRPEEYLSFRLMRVYMLGLLLAYYVGIYPKTDGDLKTLTDLRITFYTRMLEDILEDREPSQEAVQEYLHARDALRTEEEKRRQREFSVA